MSTCPSASIMQKVPGGVKGVSVLFSLFKAVAKSGSVSISYLFLILLYPLAKHP